MWKRRLLALGAAVLSLTLLGGTDWGIGNSEFACEDAVQHLLDCCPDDRSIRIINCYQARYCGSEKPELSVAQSQCLRNADCDALYESGACDNPQHGRCGGL
jgi:hypothetical protein